MAQVRLKLPFKRNSLFILNFNALNKFNKSGTPLALTDRQVAFQFAFNISFNSNQLINQV